mmetsp:Transcript_17064/g.37063  ORF Transcript_17064/g.37063 Transcript_17064/m.37063 type:complete len:86 (-) Transcript_17064:62-319(-)
MLKPKMCKPRECGGNSGCGLLCMALFDLWFGPFMGPFFASLSGAVWPFWGLVVWGGVARWDGALGLVTRPFASTPQTITTGDAMR